MKSMYEEFKKFALRGNVVDLAIGVVIGTAFNTVVTSFVTNIVTPPLGLLIGRVKFSELAIPLGGTAKIEYGLFIQALITFFITALALFFLIRFINRIAILAHLRQIEEEESHPPKSSELETLEEIRDLLKEGRPHLHEKYTSA